MAIPKRGSGVPPRGSGGSGGGEISVYNTSGGDETELGTGITELVWATQDGLGFGATIDPENPNRVIIGDPPVFEPKISWTSLQTTDVRVSESDPLEPDTYLTNGKENTVMKGTTGNFIFDSTLGRGFGPDASLTVKAYHAGTLVDEQVFDCNGNATIMKGNIIVALSRFEEDGDGSAWKGKLNVAVLSKRIVGETFSGAGSENSGECRVEISFKEHKWGEFVNISQDIFKDKDPATPSIDNGSTIRDHDDASNHVIKYISGIGYFDLNSIWQIDSINISNLNEDTSHPTANITVNAEEFGVTTFTSSPWGADASGWLNVTNLDTAQGIDYLNEISINKPSFRYIGSAKTSNTIRDSWTDAPVDESNTLKVCIDTFSQPSTDLVEYFTEENKRLEGDYTSLWYSEKYCVDGEAIVYGGGLYHGADLPRILQNTEGGLGSAGSLSTFLPDRKIDGSSRQNPNYTGHSRDAVFFREFLTPTAASYPSINMNINTNGDLAAQLASGDLKIYIWKLDSIDTTTPNIIKPSPYNPTSQEDSLAGSTWGHATYDFAAYDDGAAQTASTSGCLVQQTGNLLNLTTGGYSVVGGILVRFQIKKGVTIYETSVTFTN